MKIQNFVIWIQAALKTKHIYEDIAGDVDNRFDTSSFELNRQFPKGKYKKVIGKK